MLVLITYVQKPLVIAHADIFNGTRVLNFGLSFYLHPFLMYVSSEGRPLLIDNAISTKIVCPIL